MNQVYLDSARLMTRVAPLVLVFCPTNNFTGMKPICYGPVEVEGDGQAEYRLDD